MDNKLGQHLLSLSQRDSRICQLHYRQKELLARRSSLQEEVAALRVELTEKEAASCDVAARQALEDHRLKEEQAKIVERRKQLAAIGGAKVAKMMEREIDIAAKAIQSLEEAAIKVMEEAEVLNKEVTLLREQLEASEKALAEETPAADQELSSIENDLRIVNSERDGMFRELEPRLQRLYQRVQGRYPGSPVALASKSSCRACFRALPQQTYNQIMAGYYLIQCPGCARILIYTDEQS